MARSQAESKARNLLTGIAYSEIVASWTGANGACVDLEITDSEQSGYVISSVQDAGLRVSNVDFEEDTIRVRS